MKKRFNVIISVFICGVMLVGCGYEGGIRSCEEKKNEYLGSLPAIYAEYNAENKTLEEKKEKTKGTEAYIEANDEGNALWERTAEAASAEIKMLTGEGVPVSYSKALLDSGKDELFYNVSAELGSEEEHEQNLAIIFSFTSKHDLEISHNEGDNYRAYCRFFASDGSTITQTELFPVDHYSNPLAFTAGDLFDRKSSYTVIGIGTPNPELYVDFAGIEFITGVEYEALNK
jgi:hypothetical protein